MLMKIWVRAAGTAAVSGAILLGGCGNFGAGFFQNPSSPTTTTSGGDYVYVVNSNSTVSAFEVGTGVLTAISGNPISPGSASSVTVSRANTYLYVGGVGTIYCYSIGTTGAISVQNSSSNTALGVYNIVSMDTSPNGDYLVAAGTTTSPASEQIYVFSINASTGALTQESVATMTPPAGGAVNAVSLRVAPSGAFVGVALGGGGDLVYPFNESNGTLGTVQKATPQTGYEDNYLAFDASSSYVYLGRYGLSSGTGSVVTLSVTANGTSAPTLTPTSSVAAGDAIHWLLLNSAGTDLYTANSAATNPTISGYSVSSGVLTGLSGSPFTAPVGVSSLAEDNTGKYVIAAATGGTDLTLYKFDALNTTQLDALATYSNGGGATGSTSVAATH
jgi:6-phosphogluconolactonase (cycloisomerase 2 family)